MIVKDESAPLDEDRPCVSVTVYANGEERHYEGSSCLVAVRDENGCRGKVGGNVSPRDLAILSLTANDVARNGAEEAGMARDCGFEYLRLVIDKMQGELVADEDH